MDIVVNEDMIREARDLITRAETALGYKFTAGQMRDLLMDNTQWSSPAVTVVAACVFTERNN